MSRLYIYHCIKKFLIFFPAPTFMLLALCNVFFIDVSFCGAQSYEMAVMWFLMSIAHSKPWVEYIEIHRCPKGCGCKSM